MHNHSESSKKSQSSKKFESSKPTRAFALMGVAAVALVAAACSSSPSSSGSNSTSATNSPANTGNSGSGTSSVTVKAATVTRFGSILENNAGMALYTYAGNHGGTVNMCTGACLTAWPAVTVATGTTPKAGPGVSGTLAVARQSDGTNWVTYNGELLYTFTSDSGPGQVTGDGVNSFSVVKLAGGASGAGAATTTTKGGNGY